VTVAARDAAAAAADRRSRTATGALAGSWGETTTPETHGRRRPAISRALDLIRRQREATGEVSGGQSANGQPVAVDVDDAKLVRAAELASHRAHASADSAVVEAIGDLLEKEEAADPKGAIGSGAAATAKRRMYSGLKAFRDSLSHDDVSTALRDAEFTESDAATTAAVGASSAAADGAAQTGHERHRRHLLSHVDIQFALRTLRIHVYKLDNGVEWIDVYLGPNAADALIHRAGDGKAVSDSDLADVYHAAIAVLLQEHNVHDTLIEDAMEQVLMPQSVLLPDCCSLILRCVRADADVTADSLQALTHRLTIFLFKDKVITLHRNDLQATRSIRRRFDERFKGSTQAHLLNALVYGSLQTFRKELAQATVDFDALESRLFEPQEHRSALAREMYIIKRRAAVCARVVTMSAEAYSHAASFLRVGPLDGYFQDVIHEFQQVKTTSEELNDSAHNVMQLLFQLSSYQLNELMRVLTMFSAFFIPLTFIAGLYGMNFEHMPLVKDENGAFYCCIVMFIVGGSLLIWFRVRGF
jgi:magnesium transporter